MDIILIFLFHKLSIVGSLLFIFIEELGFPIPIFDIALTYTGYQVSQGVISFPAALILLLITDISGVTVLYILASRYGQELINRYGKYIHVDAEKLTTVETKFRKHGPLFIIVGRHIPGLRVPITIFSGKSDVTYKTFVISTCISIFPSILIYMYLGQRLGPKVERLLHIHPSYFVLLVLLPFIEVLLIYYFFLRKNRKK